MAQLTLRISEEISKRTFSNFFCISLVNPLASTSLSILPLRSISLSSGHQSFTYLVAISNEPQSLLLTYTHPYFRSKRVLMHCTSRSK